MGQWKLSNLIHNTNESLPAVQLLPTQGFSDFFGLRDMTTERALISIFFIVGSKLVYESELDCKCHEWWVVYTYWEVLGFSSLQMDEGQYSWIES